MQGHFRQGCRVQEKSAGGRAEINIESVNFQFKHILCRL